MRANELDLRELLNFQPDTGRLLMGSERMIIFRVLAFANLRRLLFDQLGHQTARALLLQFGRLCGEGDFDAIGGGLIWDTPVDRAMAGPVLHAWEGIVAVVPDTEIVPGMKKMTGIWLNSYEAEMHLAEFGPASEPICFTLQGYAHGHASKAHGIRTLCVETACRAMGDPVCRWEMRPDEEWRDSSAAASLREAFATTPQSFERRLEQQTELVTRQREAMLAMSAPVIEVWERVLVLPVIGALDSVRAAAMTEALLREITHKRASHAILDLTGVETINIGTAEYLMRMVQAAGLLGSECLVSGISPIIARTMIELGLTINIRVFPTLKSALQYTIRERDGRRP
ncbi:MAG: XylR N-terminal domain-containing protein [Nannocystis sp.]|nr:XylR N-terminal domain-containing protein [Nannocystis sp.]MBA3549130.1 XylR N-terminal domain-containing protein [Nannocystis sp.]